jgi:MFS family permease
LLADWFPEKRRATVLAIYQSGIHIGSGIGLGIGGLIVNRWDAAWVGTTAPFGLRGWQVAFFVVGLPGLLLALVVGALREPVRGQSDGIVTTPEPHPFRAFGRELRAVVPPFGVLHLWLARAGSGALAANLLAAAAIAAAAWLLTGWLGNGVQWICLGLGVYAALSWAQALRLRDGVAYALLFRTPSLRWAAFAFAALASVQYGLGFWTAPFFIRMRHVPEAEAGLMLGGIHALGGWIGVLLGGVLGDRWRQRRPAGRIYVTMLTATLPIPLALGVLTTASTTLAYALYFPQSILAALWAGPAVATIQDLVLPRMRGIASAAYLLLVTIVGLAIGPYMIGRLSVAFGDLRLAMICGLGANVAALGCALVAARHFAADEASRLARARAAGEPGL